MSVSQHFRFSLSLLLALLVVLLPGCNRARKSREIAYVSAPQASLRDRVAAVYNKMGIVKNGDRVQVLERDRRFARVRTDAGAEGWLEQRYLVSQQIYDGFNKLAQQAQGDPVQASGTTRNDTNLHIEPGRDTEHLYLLTAGTKVAILRRAMAERNLPGAQARPSPANNNQKPSAPLPVLEDWWLIKDPQARVGWVLSRLVDADVPLEIAQYAEGQRIVACFVLDEVTDADKKVAQYLVVLSEPRDGMPFDYNQLRVFTWNVKRHRYETAYRERNLNGVLPVTVSQENFDKEGMLPVFVLHIKDDAGAVSERKYKLNTPIVHRVLAPGEKPTKTPPARKRR